MLVKGLGLGGAERLVAESVVHAADAGSRFDYEVAFVLPWKDQLVGRLRERGVTVMCIGGARGSLGRAALTLRSMSRSFDLVHAHLPATGIISRMVSKAPVVYTEHNIASSYRLPTRMLNRTTYGRNTAVTAVSDAVFASLEGYPGPQPRTIRNGVAVDVVEAARDGVRAEFGVSEGQPLIVHVGNIRPHKGHENLVRTVAALRRRGFDGLVVSAGTEKHAGDLQRVRSLAEAEGVASSIRFLGRRDDAHRLIGGADLLVNPSDVEGLPVVILEAMKLGVPVVATDVGGVSTVVRPAETGWLVPPGDPESLADAVTEATSDERATAAIVEAARQLIDEQYGIDRMVDEFESVYEEILQ